MSSSDVKSSRSDWHRSQNFGLGLGLYNSAYSIWPRPGLGLVNLTLKMCYPMRNILAVSISWLYHCKFLFARTFWQSVTAFCYPDGQ